MHCQKCRTPLRLDASLQDLNPAALNLLVGASHVAKTDTMADALPLRPMYPPERKKLYDEVSRNASKSTLDRALPEQDNRSAAREPTRDATKETMSFYMVNESALLPSPPPLSPEQDSTNKSSRQEPGSEQEIMTGALSTQMETVSRLFDILSSRSDIDQPICVECTDLLVEGLQKRLEVETKERDARVAFLKQAKIDVPAQEEVEQSASRLKAAQDREAAAIQELIELEKEKEAVDLEIAMLEKESQALDVEEEAFWRERNAFAMKLADFQNERDSVNTKYDHDSRQLEKLRRTNVYNDTFCISHDGLFGTINGLRLGRLPSAPVEWPEINAAWGYTILLLVTVANRLSFKFEDYELQPMGSTSRILRIDRATTASSNGRSSRRAATPKSHVLELYSSGDMPLGLTFMHRKLDIAMVAFLECMRQLGSFVEAETTQVGRPIRLPYKIDNDKIGDISIKLGFATVDYDDWSKACKYVLTCCKFLLAHASNIDMSSRNNVL